MPVGFHECRNGLDLDASRLRARQRAAPGTFFACAPGPAVEAMSPDDTWEQVEKKVQQYLDAGGKAVWVFSPTLAKVHVFDAGKPRRVLCTEDVLDDGAALPGFSAPVREFFEGVRGEGGCLLSRTEFRGSVTFRQWSGLLDEDAL